MKVSVSTKWLTLISLFSGHRLPFEESRKRLLFGFAGTFCGVCLVFFAVRRFLDANYELALINSVAATTIMVTIWRARAAINARVQYRIFVSVCCVMLCFAVTRGDPETYRLLWLYTFVPIAFFLMGSREGLIFSLIPSTAWLFALFLPSAISGPAVYEPNMAIRFVLTLSLLISTSWYFEAVRGIYSATVLERQNELESDREKMHSLAFSDELTGLPNRRSVIHFLDDSIAALTYDESKSAMVAMLDIDHFKIVNDRYGHAVGDRVLVEVARRVNHVIRATDFVGRFGGEEFLIVVPAEASSRYRSIIEQIRTAICDTPIIVDTVAIKVTVSIGASITTKGLDGGQVIDQADHALYAAKQSGRNCALFFEDKNYFEALDSSVSIAS